MADLGTDFSLPDDSPEGPPEDDGIAEEVGLPDEPTPPAPALVQTREEAPNEESPMLESDEKSAQQSTDAPTAGQSPMAQSPEESGDASDENEGGVDDSVLQQWDALDLELERITEDRIDLLVRRKMIAFTNFPGMAQQKIINRRMLRSNMFALTNTEIDNDCIF